VAEQNFRVQDLAPEIRDHAASTPPIEPLLPEEGLDFEAYIGGLELALIRRSLERTQGNKRQAAQLLRLKRTTLIEKLKRLDPQLAATPANEPAPLGVGHSPKLT